jgi:hypothetical protein
MSTRPIAAVVLTALAIIVAGCGAQAPSAAPSATPSAAATPSPSSSPAPAALLLKVTSEGGFINPAATLAALPIVTVYADGRILSPAQLAADPPPLVAAVDVRDVGPAGASAILAAIKAAGLDKEATGGPGIPGDSGTDVFTVVIDGAMTTTRLVGGGPPGPGLPGGSGGGDTARQAAFDLLAKLLDPAETWGAGRATTSTLAPVGYRVYVAPADAAAASGGPAPIAWPLATALDAFGTAAIPDRGITGLRQGVVLGPDAMNLAAVLRGATTISVFTSGGRSYTLYVRPLLPDEIAG